MRKIAPFRPFVEATTIRVRDDVKQTFEDAAAGSVVVMAGVRRHRGAVIETNYITADQMARDVASRMVEEGWGRIINVTTTLDR